MFSHSESSTVQTGELDLGCWLRPYIRGKLSVSEYTLQLGDIPGDSESSNHGEEVRVPLPFDKARIVFTALVGNLFTPPQELARFFTFSLYKPSPLYTTNNSATAMQSATYFSAIVWKNSPVTENINHHISRIIHSSRKNGSW